MTLTDPAGEARFIAKFAELSTLEKGQERPVRVLERVPMKVETEPKYLDVVICLDPRYAVESYTMRIEYQDIRGGAHWSEIHMGRGGSNLLRFN